MRCRRRGSARGPSDGHIRFSRCRSTTPSTTAVSSRRIRRHEHKFPPMRRTTHTYLTAREVADLADACGDQGDVVLILAYSGLRFGELTGLNVEDVDVEARRIRVRRSITQLSGRLLEGPPKSRAGRRSVPIPA